MPFDVTDTPVAPQSDAARSTAPGADVATDVATATGAGSLPMTRRERIAAERHAAGLAPRERAAQPVMRAGVPVSPDVVLPVRVAAESAVPTSPDVVVRVRAAQPVASAAAPVSPDVSPRLPAAPMSPIDAAPASPVGGVSAAPAPAASVDRRAARAAVRRTKRSVAPVTATATPTPRRRSSFRRNASTVTGGAVLLVVAGMIVGTSVPAQAFYTPTQIQGLRDAATTKTQSLQVGATGETGATDTNRDSYSVTDAVVQPQHTSNTFTNDPNGTIQWPFLTGVPISSQFGARNVEGCSFCSTFHEGVDFAPGEGTAIRSVAAGTVIKVKADDGGYGNDVWVQHDVDGKQFVSVYGHMKDGTFKVVEGQQIAVGTELGEVGSTGNSTGPHLHLEIHVNDVPVDPLAWLEANAN